MYGVVAFVVTYGAYKMNPSLEHSEFIHDQIKKNEQEANQVDEPIGDVLPSSSINTDI